MLRSLSEEKALALGGLSLHLHNLWGDPQGWLFPNQTV